MPTVIDTLQIEIQSGSANASKGIDEFAESLKKLKANGKLTTVTKNLTALSAAAKGLAGISGAASTLYMLASAVERLRGIKSIASLTNNLTKLPAALKGIENINLWRVEEQIRGIVSAVGPLTEIKTSGFASMVNGMAKIDKVTRELDDEKINAFAERVKKLNDLLGPLSEKMATIGPAFKAINTGAGKAAKAVEKFDNGVNTSTLNLASFIEVARTAVQTVASLVQKFVEFISVAIEWDGVKAQFGNAFGEQADEYYEKITRITEALRINKQAFMENSAMAASMLTGFGVKKEDAREMGLGYTELAYDIWAAYNNVYKTLDGADGAMAAVRSAIAGEVEPIRRAGFTIVESTLAQTAAQHGLNISIEKATEAQKSYLRYLTLVDQARSKGVVGTFAREMNTAEGMMRTFSQQLKSLAQAFGSLFLPILTKVMPYFQAFIELLEEGVRMIAAFFGVKIQDIGETWNDYSTSIDPALEGTEAVTGALGDAADAAKELKNATIGIDELNVISPKAADSGSGGAGDGAGGGFDGLDVESLWDESIFNNLKDQVDQIKEKFRDWLPVIATVSAAISGLTLAYFIDEIDKAIKNLGTLGKAVSVITITATVGKIVWDLTGAYLEGGDITEWLKILGATAVGTALAYYLAGPVGAGLVLVTSGVVQLTRLALELKDGQIDWGDSQTWVTAITGSLSALLGGGVIAKSGIPQKIGKAIVDALETGYLKALFAVDWLKGLGSTLATAFSGVAKFVPKLGTAIWTGLKGLGSAIASHPWVTLAVAVVTALVGAIIMAIVDYDFTDVGYKLGNAIGKAFKKVADFFGKAGDWVVAVARAIRDGFYAAIDWCYENLNPDKIKDFIAFVIDPKSWTEIIIPKMLEVGKNILTGLWNGIKNGWQNLKENIIEFCDGFVQGFKDALGIHSPSKVFMEIGKDIIAGLVKPLTPSAIKDKLVAMWDAAKKWWDGKSALKEYTPSIGSIYEKVKARWDNARVWYNDKKTKMKEYTPSIGSIYDKAKERWDNARTWWNEKKTAMKTYTPSIGSILDKVKSIWNTAKNWWNNNVKGLKLDIKTPKIKLEWTSTTVLGKTFRYPTGFDVYFAKDGGMFDAGSLIWAGERGAEIVANAGGGKTGVMNIEQMQEAVYEGVYAAMSAAMGKQNGGAQSVNVYLDSRQITSTVEQRQREKGASIMGNEVFA